MDYRLPAATAARGAGDSRCSPDPTAVAAAAAYLAAQASHGSPAEPSSREAMKARIRARILAEEAAQERILEEEVRRELEIERGMAERLAEVQSLGLLPPSVTVNRAAPAWSGERSPLPITHHPNHTNIAGEGIGSISVPLHHTNMSLISLYHPKAPMLPLPPPPNFDPMFGINLHHQPPYPDLHFQPPAHHHPEMHFPPLSNSGEEVHSQISDSGRGKDVRVGVRNPKKIAKEKKKLWWEKAFGKGGAPPPPVVCMEICSRCGESGHLPRACLASKEEADWYQKGKLGQDDGVNRDDICFLCGQKGHWSRICRASEEVRAAYKESLAESKVEHQAQGGDIGPSSSGAAVSSNHQSNLGQNGQISTDNICFQCGKKGHWSRICKASKEVRAAYKKSQAESRVGHETQGEDVGPESSGAVVYSNHQKSNLGQADMISTDNICFQCGKKGHWSRICKASEEERTIYKKSWEPYTRRVGQKARLHALTGGEKLNQS